MRPFYDFFSELQNMTPDVFESKHIIGTSVILLLITFFMILSLRQGTIKGKYRILQFAVLFLWFLELSKYSHAIITTGSFPKRYIPMQLCSFSLYLMPIVAFSKGKLATFIKPTAFAIGMLSGLIVLIYPATVLGGDMNWTPFVQNIIPIISFLYHGVMVFFGLYMLLAKVYVPSHKDFPRAYVTLLFFAVLAMITNAFFDTDMMFLNTANGSPFQFVLEEYGRIIYTLTMMVLAFALLYIPFIPSVLHDIRMKHRKASKSFQKSE